MRDVAAQLRRGMKSTGFWMAVVLQVFALSYVHMDAGLFWHDPLEYFRCGDFCYTFFISTELGLSWFLLPIVAILPMGFVFVDDKQSGYVNLVLYRQDRTRYILHRTISACCTGVLAMLIALFFYTTIILAITPWTDQGTGWKESAMAGPYGWRASSKYFYVLIFECFGRLSLSVVIWVLFGLAISNIWQNRVFVTVAVIATNLFLESFISIKTGYMNCLSYLQVPQCGTEQSLSLSFMKQLLYLISALGVFLVTVWFRFSLTSHLLQEKVCHVFEGLYQTNYTYWGIEKFKGMTIKRLVAELRSYSTWKTLIWSVITGCFVVLLSSNAQQVTFSVGDVLLECYGGMEWATPLVDFSAIARWTMLLLPSMMGVALNLEREMGTRSLITINRYGSKVKWWTYKGIALFIYVLISVFVMLLATIFTSYVMGAKEFGVYMEDAEGFSILRTDVVWLTMVFFTLQIMMLTQVQIMMHSISNDMRVGILIYIVPVVISSIMASNVDHLWNEWIPYNWGMILRCEIFASKGYFIEDINGKNEWIAQCSVPFERALGYQLMITIILYVMNHVIMQMINVTSRNNKG